MVRKIDRGELGESDSEVGKVAQKWLLYLFMANFDILG